MLPYLITLNSTHANCSLSHIKSWRCGRFCLYKEAHCCVAYKSILPKCRCQWARIVLWLKHKCEWNFVVVNVSFLCLQWNPTKHKYACICILHLWFWLHPFLGYAGPGIELLWCKSGSVCIPVISKFHDSLLWPVHPKQLSYVNSWLYKY
jgi:hypothetical protein